MEELRSGGTYAYHECSPAATSAGSSSSSSSSTKRWISRPANKHASRTARCAKSDTGPGTVPLHHMPALLCALSTLLHIIALQTTVHAENTPHPCWIKGYIDRHPGYRTTRTNCVCGRFANRSRPLMPKLANARWYAAENLFWQPRRRRGGMYDSQSTTSIKLSENKSSSPEILPIAALCISLIPCVDISGCA